MDGNVNLNLLGGNIAEFYGGGWHGGSAYKKQLNVSSERAAQRQYHREEVAVVTGDVNIVMGGTMTLCQNQSQAWGGSYASTIKGDVNITIKDKAKLAARYSLNNGGAPPLKIWASWTANMRSIMTGCIPALAGKAAFTPAASTTSSAAR